MKNPGMSFPLLHCPSLKVIMHAFQCHLLAMKGSFGVQQAPRSFTKLILSIIKILSGILLSLVLFVNELVKSY